MKTIVSKLANALVPDAEIDEALLEQVAGAAQTKAIAGTLDKQKSKMKGLWVGGRCVLTEESLNFEQNSLNDAVHTGDYSFSIPLESITDVEYQFAFLTGIVQLETKSGNYQVRMYGAKKFVALLSDIIEKAPS